MRKPSTPSEAPDTASIWMGGGLDEYPVGSDVGSTLASVARGVQDGSRRAETLALARLGLRQTSIRARTTSLQWSAEPTRLSGEHTMGMTDDHDTVYCDVQMPLAHCYRTNRLRR